MKIKWLLYSMAGLMFLLAAGRARGQASAEAFSHWAGTLAYDLDIRDQRLGGQGAELLLFEATRNDFLVMGTDPGVAEIPPLASAIFQHAYNMGLRFTHFALPAAPPLAAALESRALDAAADELLPQLYRSRAPLFDAFRYQEYTQLLMQVMETADVHEEVLWGLDALPPGAEGLVLARLAERISPDDNKTQKMIQRWQKEAEKGLEKYQAQGDPSACLLFTMTEADFASLLGAFPEDERAIHLIIGLQQARQVQQLLAEGDTLGALRQRLQIMEDQFSRYYEYALSQEAKPPRLMITGAAPMLYKGTYPQTSLPSLGQVIDQYAGSQQRKSFHIRIMAGPDTARDSLAADSLTQQPLLPAELAWMAPLSVHAREGWKVFELTAMRRRMEEFELPAPLKKLIREYDALIILGGSQPATPID